MGVTMSKNGAPSKKTGTADRQIQPTTERALTRQASLGEPVQTITIEEMEEWVKDVSRKTKATEESVENATEAVQIAGKLLKELDEIIALLRARSANNERIMQQLRDLQLNDEMLCVEARSWLIRAKELHFGQKTNIRGA